MNFYKRHLGDIAKSCGDLSQGQMGAYDLLLDWHYANEKPIPLAPEKVYRIGRASTKAERDNVDSVLDELFTRTVDGYTHKRAAEEMEKANAQAETNRRIAEEREEKKRARKEHEPCYETSNESCTNRQPIQTPDSISQIDQDQKISGTPTNPETPGTEAGRVCGELRKAGCLRVNPSHPDLLAALFEGVTAEALVATYLEDPNKTNPFTWTIATARGRHREGARIVATGPPRLISPAAPSKTKQTLLKMQARQHANELDRTRDQQRITEADFVELRSLPGA